MKCIIAIACLLGIASAWNNGNNGYMGSNNMRSNNYNDMMYLSKMMNNYGGMGNGGMGNSGMGNGGMGNNGNNNNNMQDLEQMIKRIYEKVMSDGGRPQQGQTGGYQGIIGMLVGNLISGHGQQQHGQGQDQDNYPMGSMEDRRELEAMAKNKMTSELVEMVLQHMKHKAKEEAFHQSIKSLCFILRAKVMVERNRTMEPIRDADSLDFEAMTEREKNSFENHPAEQRWEDLMDMDALAFDRRLYETAAFACKSSWAYIQETHKMEKMNRGEGDCSATDDKDMLDEMMGNMGDMGDMGEDRASGTTPSRDGTAPSRDGTTPSRDGTTPNRVDTTPSV